MPDYLGDDMRKQKKDGGKEEEEKQFQGTLVKNILKYEIIYSS